MRLGTADPPLEIIATIFVNDAVAEAAAPLKGINTRDVLSSRLDGDTGDF